MSFRKSIKNPDRALPVLFCLPTMVVWATLFYRLLFGYSAALPFPSLVGWVLGLSFLGLAACIAMIFVRQDTKWWRYAALFNAVPYLLTALVAPFAG